jgi:ribose transport system ATP-binding protein
MPVLKLRGIKKRFGQTVALDGVDLALERGEVHALIGENGAGKSTLMNVIAGSLRADEGAMELNEQPYSPTDPLDARKNGIAFIHQELSLASHLSVAENILMGIEASRFGWFDRKETQRKAYSVLENFHHPDIKPEMPVGRLSPAAQQVVEICRAVASNASIVLMDEPTSSLQQDDVRQLFSLIRKLKADGISIIYISHFLEELREIADGFTVLRDGRSVAAGNMPDVTDGFLVSQMVGREVENLYPHRLPKTGEMLLRVENLSSPPALKSASFELRAGEIFGIAGLMGAGRTEMVRAIFGVDRAASGTITVNGKATAAMESTPAFRVAQNVGYLSEDRKQEGLALALSIADNITFTRFSSCSSFGFLDLAKQKKQSEDVAKKLGVRAATVKLPVQTLSGGNQQKVAFGRLLHQDAEILLLDEPARGIDIGSKVKIYETMAKLADQGKAILMVSSYLPELFGMCDRLAVMTRGVLSPARLISEWTPELVMKIAIGSGDGAVDLDGN